MENPDTRRDRLQPQLESAVGSGQLSMEEYESLMELLWSEEDSVEDTHANLDRVAGRVDRINREIAAQPPATPDPSPLVRRPGPGEPALPAQEGKSAFMSTIKRNGSWALQQATTWWSFMGETEIDLREAQWPSDTISLNLQGFFGEYRIIVPPGTQVIDNGTNVASEFTEKDQAGSKKKKRKRDYTSDNPYAPDAGAGDVANQGNGLTVIIDGFNLFSEVKIRYR